MKVKINDILLSDAMALLWKRTNSITPTHTNITLKSFTKLVLASRPTSEHCTVNKTYTVFAIVGNQTKFVAWYDSKLNRGYIS